MGVRIIHDSPNNIAAIYCSTSGFAFGPTFEGTDAHEDAEAFCDWFNSGEAARAAETANVAYHGDGRDPRHFDDAGLEVMQSEWIRSRKQAAAA